MYLPTELWTQIINANKFDIDDYKSYILVNSAFHKIIKKIIDQFPDKVTLQCMHGSCFYEGQYYKSSNYVNYKDKIIKRKLKDFKLTISKSEVLSSKIIRFPLYSSTTTYTEKTCYYLPLIFSKIFVENNKVVYYIDNVPPLTAYGRY